MIKDMWFNFWSGFDRVFNNPKKIHRVIVIAILATTISHVAYVFSLYPDDYIFTTSDKVSIWLGSMLSLFVLCWGFRANEMSIDLFNRFAIVSALCGLFHRMIFYAIELGDPYFVTISIICFIVFGIWAITGKNYSEVKNDYIRPALKFISRMFVRHEKKDNIHVISDSKFADHG